MTMAVDFIAKSFQLSDGSVVNCLIYDTAGQEKFNSINESYYQKADAVLLVYDISDRKSFEKIVDYYCPKIEEHCRKKIPVILLGNKADKENERQVSIEEGAALAVEHKYKFKETSCKKNENVADAFEALIEMWNIEYHKKNLIHITKNEGLKRCDTGSYKIMINKEKGNKNFKYSPTIKLEDIHEEVYGKSDTFKIEHSKHKKDKEEKKKKCQC